MTGLSASEATALRRREIRIVSQQSNLLPALTALEQVAVMNELGARGSWGRRKAVRARVAELLDAVGLADRCDKRPHQLSEGQRQRVNIARALANESNALLVDELTSALGAERGAAIIDPLVRLTAERETSTLLATHDLVHLPRLHAVVHMVDGRLAQAASVDSAF